MAGRRKRFPPAGGGHTRWGMDGSDHETRLLLSVVERYQAQADAGEQGALLVVAAVASLLEERNVADRSKAS